jgi:hypothetical protein
VIEEVVLFKRVEKLDGHEFVHIERESNGSREVKYWIDSKVAEKDEFMRARLEAKEQEWIEKEKMDEDKRIQAYEFRCRARHTIAQKLISQELQKIEHMLKQLKAYTLTPYFVFGDGSFGSQEEFDQLVGRVVPQAHELLKKEWSTVDDAELTSMLNELTKYNEKMHNFLELTYEKAIEKSDDTKLLKQLFEVVA